MQHLFDNVTKILIMEANMFLTPGRIKFIV